MIEQINLVKNCHDGKYDGLVDFYFISAMIKDLNKKVNEIIDEVNRITVILDRNRHL